MRLKWKVVECDGNRVRVTFFAGDGDELTDLGTLNMCVSAYQLIGAIVLLGAERTFPPTDIETDDNVFVRWYEKCGHEVCEPWATQGGKVGK